MIFFRNFVVKILFLIFTFSINVYSSFSQGFIDKPRKSPIGIANYKEDSLYVKITYGRPKLKHDLALPFGINTRIAEHPFGKIWRTGEDDATEILLTKPLNFCGNPLEAGIYTLFTIPDSLEWTIILNKEVGMWGTYQYNPEKDVLRVKVPVYRSPKVFLDFSIFFQKSEEGVDIVMIWGREAIRLPLVF